MHRTFFDFQEDLYLIFSRIGKRNIIAKSSKRFEKNLRKDARRNQLLQHRKKKREQIFAQKRNFGGFSSAPVLICVIPLHSDIDAKNIVSVVTSMDESANVATGPNGVTHIGYAMKEETSFPLYFFIITVV